MTGFVRCPHEVYNTREVRKNLPFSFTDWFHGFQMFKFPLVFSRAMKDQQGRDDCTHFIDKEIEGQGGEVIHPR